MENTCPNTPSEIFSFNSLFFSYLTLAEAKLEKATAAGQFCSHGAALAGWVSWPGFVVILCEWPACSCAPELAVLVPERKQKGYFSKAWVTLVCLLWWIVCKTYQGICSQTRKQTLRASKWVLMKAVASKSSRPTCRAGCRAQQTKAPKQPSPSCTEWLRPFSTG